VVLHRSASFLCDWPRRSPTDRRRRSACTLRAGGATPRGGRSYPAHRRARRAAPKRPRRWGLARRYDCCVLDPILASTSHEVKVRSLTALRRRASGGLHGLRGGLRERDHRVGGRHRPSGRERPRQSNANRTRQPLQTRPQPLLPQANRDDPSVNRPPAR
jgi:hypothetical protein